MLVQKQTDRDDRKGRRAERSDSKDLLTGASSPSGPPSSGLDHFSSGPSRGLT